MLSAFFGASTLAIPQCTNWDQLIAEASSQLMLPALGYESHARGLNDQLPAEVLNLFNTAETLNAERNQAILAEAVHVAALLNQIGIQPVALKGLAYLLTNTYPNPAARYLLDIDLLLPKDQIPAAITHLFHNGYAKNESAHFVQFRHHYPAICRPNAPNIEIHHRVGQGICNHLLPAKTLLTNATPLTYGCPQVTNVRPENAAACKIDLPVCRLGSSPGPSNNQIATFLIPTPTDLVNHLILHSQLAHPYCERIFPPLRALVDLTQLQTRFADEINWSLLAQTYRENNQSATLTLHLHQAKDTLGFKIPPPIPNQLDFPLTTRYNRRKFLNQHPTARFLDPTYILLSLFSRRLRLLPLILRTPSTWPQLLQLLITPAFYRNLIG